MKQTDSIISFLIAVFKKKFGLLLMAFIVCCSTAGLLAQPATELYTSANDSYKNGKFEEAAVAYEKILVQGYRTPEVYYNLGNCYYKLNNIGRSILNFERAHKLAPDDEDITHNLQLARLKAIDKIVPVPQLAITTAWHSFTSSHSAKGWGVFALAFIWITLVAIAAYLLVSKRTFILFLSGLFLFLSIASLSLAYKQYRSEKNPDEAILLVPQAVVKSAPDANGTDLFTVHEGIRLQILDRVGNWSKVRLADGKVGWLEEILFERI